MIVSLQSWLRTIFPARFRASLRGLTERVQIQSILQAIKEQGLSELYTQLTEIVPNIQYQYSGFELDTDYLRVNVRALHAFQIFLFEQALVLLRFDLTKKFTVVDIGDSAGTHVQYLRKLHPNLHSLSVNSDKQAIDRIMQKGLEALQVRAEDLQKCKISPDIFISFEMIEHLSNPILFLRSLSGISGSRALIITVPYVAQSRVGLDYIRTKRQTMASPESVHVFELCPADWKLLFLFSGWKVLYERVYFQYPRLSPLYLMKPYWRAIDFEGFYGAILIPDNTWSILYHED